MGDGRRVVLRSVEAPVQSARLRLSDGDVVVASGGARGVTAATLIALASCARLRFVLLGRTTQAAEPAECAGIEELSSDERTFTGLSIGSLVVGGASLVATLVYALASGGRTTPEARSAIPKSTLPLRDAPAAFAHGASLGI